MWNSLFFIQSFFLPLPLLLPAMSSLPQTITRKITRRRISLVIILYKTGASWCVSNLFTRSGVLLMNKSVSTRGDGSGGGQVMK